MRKHLPIMRVAGAALLLAALTFGAACREPTAAPAKKQSAQGPAPATTPAAAEAKDLPEPPRPEPLPAERVVDLFFTSNNDGEVEPCG